MPSSSWSSSTPLGPVGSEDKSITIIRTVGSCLPSRHSVTSQKVWIFRITLCYPQILQTEACPINDVNGESMGLSTDTTGNVKLCVI
jgi:hypothetical protein